jgi:hypothetical protein
VDVDEIGERCVSVPVHVEAWKLLIVKESRLGLLLQLVIVEVKFRFP